MRRTFLITAFLALSAAISCAARYTVQFGDAGGLVIQYEVSTTESSEIKGWFKNTVSGTLTNTTKFPLSCIGIHPIVPGTYNGVLLGLPGADLDAGASQTFSKNDMASETNVSGVGISGWKAGVCTTPLDYLFSHRTVTKTFSAGVIIGEIGKTQIGITVENKSDQPIEIVWNESSFIDRDRSAKRIFHSGVKYIDRELPQPNTTIPPLAKVEDAAIPTENVYLEEGQDGGWREDPLFPSVVFPELAEKSIASMKGARVALFLHLLVGGKKTPLTLLFEVAAVKPAVKPLALPKKNPFVLDQEPPRL